MDLKPNASRVSEVLLRQHDPANWSDEMWEAHRQDMQELHEAVEREQEKHSLEARDRR